MTTATGAALQRSDTARIDGRWYTLTGDPRIPTVGGEPYPIAREVQATDSAGREAWLLYFTGDTYALAGTTATLIDVTDYSRAAAGGRYGTRTFEVSYTKREYGGWHVRLASNRRLLGWLTRTYPDHPDGGRDWDRPTGWDAHCASDAFRGTGPDDEGDILDDVPTDLYGGVQDTAFQSHTIGSGRTRDEATSELISRLWSKSAPALGFGPHYRVRRWADRRR